MLKLPGFAFCTLAMNFYIVQISDIVKNILMKSYKASLSIISIVRIIRISRII